MLDQLENISVYPHKVHLLILIRDCLIVSGIEDIGTTGLWMITVTWKLNLPCNNRKVYQVTSLYSLLDCSEV